MSFVKKSSTSRKRESVEWTQNRLWCLRERKEQPAILKRLPNLGPPLQNRLWDILVRSRFYPVLLTGDLKKAFLQIRIKEEEKDVLRFHWKPPNRDEILIFCFTRALFGMTCSPFLLGGVINQHLDTWERQLPSSSRSLATIFMLTICSDFHRRGDSQGQGRPEQFTLTCYRPYKPQIS